MLNVALSKDAISASSEFLNFCHAGSTLDNCKSYYCEMEALAVAKANSLSVDYKVQTASGAQELCQELHELAKQDRKSVV